MATPNQYVQTNTLYLSGSGVIIGATSVSLTTLTDIYANVLTMADFGTTGYGTLEPDTTNEEAFTFTGVTANANGTYTLTGVKTALAKSPYTQTSGLVRGHVGGSKVVITDNAAFWNTFANKTNDETIAGQWTFTNTPIVPGTVSNASTSVKGVAYTSTAPASAASPTMVETGDPRVPVAYAVDSVGSDSYAITPSPAITAYAAGQRFTFQAGTANTGTATLNVNGLGAKTIKKNSSSDLATGDILASQVVTVVYDGTNMQLISGANIGITTIGSTSGVGNPPAADSTQTITHGLGRVPVIIRISGIGMFAANASAVPPNQSSGVYDSSGNSCIYIQTQSTVTNASNPVKSTTFAVRIGLNTGNNGCQGVIQNVTSSSFDIVWTCSGDSSSSVYLWEAQ